MKGYRMRTFLVSIATFATLALSGFAVTASAQGRMLTENGPLGLERAVRINGVACMMTTPYDLWAKCGTERIELGSCTDPAFEDNKLVCRGFYLPTTRSR